MSKQREALIFALGALEYAFDEAKSEEDCKMYEIVIGRVQKALEVLTEPEQEQEQELVTWIKRNPPYADDEQTDALVFWHGYCA